MLSCATILSQSTRPLYKALLLGLCGLFAVASLHGSTIRVGRVSSWDEYPPNRQRNLGYLLVSAYHRQRVINLERGVQ